MDMKKILQALDTASTKPVEGSDDMKKIISIVTEGANPHKVTLPVQMAMQHYQEETKPAVVTKESVLKKYFQEAEEIINQEKAERKEHLKMYASKVAKRVLENRRPDAYERDYQSSISGFGHKDSLAYQMDGGANDEGWDKEDDYRPRRSGGFRSSRPGLQDAPHDVYIDGRKWKTFDSHSHANNVAKKLQAKGKKATVQKSMEEGIGDIAQQAWTGVKSITGGLTPEDIAKQQSPAGDAMKKLLAFKVDPRYASNPNAQKQIQMRIDDLTNRINLDKGMPVDAQGNPKQVVPPEQFKE